MKIIESNKPQVNLDEEVTVSLTIRELIELYACCNTVVYEELAIEYQDLGFSYDQIDSGVTLMNTMRSFLQQKGVNV